MDIARERVKNQLFATKNLKTPADVVSYFGAMQAQDYYGAKWAIGLRSNFSDAQVEEAFNKGEILRTHIMRPTWHFVCPQDIRWMLSLTSPRVHKFNGHYYKKSGLDKSIFAKSNKIIEKALKGRKQLTRAELNEVLIKEKIPTDKMGLSYTIMQAELDGVICSGPRKGLNFTYMLLDERVPKFKILNIEESLVELTTRYFKSHGPAQFKDFIWWSGLTFADAKKAVELLGAKISKEVANEKIYWSIPGSKNNLPENSSVFLLPGFDEYFIAYNDRSDILNPKYAKELNLGGGMLRGAILVKGKMVGGWKRTITSKGVGIKLQFFAKISGQENSKILQEAERFGKFLALPVRIESR